MKCVLVLALALIVETGCGGRIASPAKNDSLDQSAAMPVNSAVAKADRTDASEEPKQSKEAPTAFRGIDFKNLSYPISWSKERVPLKDGKRKYYEHKDFGSGWFDLDNIYYVDVTGDGREEAVVQLHAVQCGASCDGGAHLFNFYMINRSKLRLLWRFETGSLGYGCGLKSFDLKKRRLTLEVFNTCNFKGAALEPRYESGHSGGKFHAESVTRFTFEFQGRKSVLRKREVFPSREEELRGHRSKIIINHD